MEVKLEIEGRKRGKTEKSVKEGRVKGNKGNGDFIRAQENYQTLKRVETKARVATHKKYKKNYQDNMEVTRTTEPIHTKLSRVTKCNSERP